ncbi:MAG: TIGR03936 family radical SAM-associated protein [Candidatus Brocadiia bacterium]
MSRVKHNIRIRFTKEGDLRFISHHDLMRVFERALRRADLPVAMSEGYNPRPRLSFPAPLSVGYIGRNEVADVGLYAWLAPEEFRRRLQKELPDELSILSAESTRTNPNRQPHELSYRIPLLDDHPVTEERIEEFLARHEWVITRRRGNGKSKQVEIRQFVKALRLQNGTLRMLLATGNRGTARPEEVLEALDARRGRDYLFSSIERTHVNLPSSD